MARNPRRLYIGLMSGTSMDGIDAALVAIGERDCEVLAAQTTTYAGELGMALRAASRNPGHCDVDTLCRLDRAVGEAFRDAARGLLEATGTNAAQVTAIGSHGQTLRHRPRGERPFTLQLGDPNLIAAGTGITTVADFRRADLAQGGEGAPLTPAFHHWRFGVAGRHRVVLNLGGFANITVLPAGSDEITGFDTGPGNSLMDAFSLAKRGRPMDENGRWAAAGKVHPALLERLLADPYFMLPPPKSTGFEYFNDAWLAARLDGLDDIPAADLQATLCELTARSVADAIRRAAPDTSEVLACGGGVRNPELWRRLAAALDPIALESTASAGLDPNWIEAAAFAWLAARRLAGRPGNLPSVTGARAPAVLGGVWHGGG